MHWLFNFQVTHFGKRQTAMWASDNEDFATFDGPKYYALPPYTFSALYLTIHYNATIFPVLTDSSHANAIRKLFTASCT